MSQMKLTLDLGGITEDFFEETKLLGIIAAAKSYRFCWLVNNRLGFNFRLNTDIDIHIRKKNRNYYFPVYQFTVPNTIQHHYIYQNQYDGEYLLPEFKHIDFLWLLKGCEMDDTEYTQLLQQMRSLGGVQLVAELTNEHIKNKGNLIF